MEHATKPAPFEDARQAAAQLVPVIDSGILLRGDPLDEDDEVEPNEKWIRTWAHRLSRFGVEDWDTGSFRAVFFLGDWVLKVPLDRTSISHSTDELALLETLPQADLAFFPETHDLGSGILLQARWNWDQARYDRHEAVIQQEVARLGLRHVHKWNIGWRGEQWRIIDFALRA